MNLLAPRFPADDAFDDIIADVLAVDSERFAEGAREIFVRHQGRLGPRLVAALDAAAIGFDARGEGDRGTTLRFFGFLLQDALARAERQRPTPLQSNFVARMLLRFARTDGTGGYDAAEAELYAELAEYPGFADEALPHAMRELARDQVADLARPDPGRLRTVLTLGVAALAHRVRHHMRAQMSEAFLDLGTALGTYPGPADRVAIREAAAVSCYAGYTLLLPETAPEDRAEALNTLGLAILSMEGDDRKARSREAIQCFHTALGLLEDEPFPPVLWADTQSNLALALVELARDSADVDEDEALDAVNSALSVFDHPVCRDVFPKRLARARLGLGIVLLERIGGDRPENLAGALRAWSRPWKDRRPQGMRRRWR